MKGRTAAFLILIFSCLLGIAVSISLATRNLSRPQVAVDPSPQSTRPDVSLSAPASKESIISIHKERRAHEPSSEATLGREKGTVRAKRPERVSAFLYFRDNQKGENYGKLARAMVDAIDKPQYSTELHCDRVHFAGGVGVCLSMVAPPPGSPAAISYLTGYVIISAIGFDQEMRRLWTTELVGLPSRARVSPSGRLAAVTLFRFGESYASLNFSTQTTILDAASGSFIADLEQFSVTRNGMQFRSPDFNFWGVSFSRDENIFYATLWSKGRTYLVEGDLAKRNARVIHDGVECPSLSPDGTRIAFKKRVGENPIVWRITVLDLQTGIESSLGENRSVDDQVEWLDKDRVVYALSNGRDPGHVIMNSDIWVLSTHEAATPQLFLKGGFSPAVSRSQILIGSSALREPNTSRQRLLTTPQ